MIHPNAVCETIHVGERSMIWAFAHLLPECRIGSDYNICDGVFIEDDVFVGNRVTVKGGVQLWDGVWIEDDVFNGSNATFTNDLHPRSRDHGKPVLKTRVCSRSSIGANATILPGLTIGRQAMIGTGAVVTQSVPPFAVVVDNPGRIVGYSDSVPPSAISDTSAAVAGRIPFSQLADAVAELRLQIDSAISRVLDSGLFSLGPELEAPEHELAAWCGASHAVGVSSGLDVLHLILRAWDIGPGDEVIVPSNSYIASWLGVTMAGVTPVLVEPEWDTCCTDAQLIEAAITPRIKAMMPVHLHGHVCDMTVIVAIARRHGLKAIEDAAQAHGAEEGGRRMGSLGDAIAWSFYPSKNLGALGDAGAVTTHDPETASRLKMWRNSGSAVHYVNEVPGYNNRLDEIHAAVPREKIKVFAAWNDRREIVAQRYQSAFAGTGLTLPMVRPGTRHAWHLHTIRHPKCDHLWIQLEQAGIGTLIHDPIPPHRQKAFAELGLANASFPVTEKIHAETLSLPLGPHLSVESQDRVIAAVFAAIQTL